MTNADEAYRTIAKGASASLTIRGSEFIGHISPAESVAAAEAFVERVREEYDDATHNVPAYRVRAGDSTLGEGMVREYASDDGEPAGSAGKPISNVLQGEDLENVVCVVTRYYGGTDLGIGGLVRAYGNATKAAIDAADAVVERPHERVTVTAEYDDSGTVRAILESDYVEFDAAYEETVTFDIRVPTTDVEASATGYGAQRAGVRESNKGVGERRIEAADPGPKNGSNRSVSRDDTESRTSIGDRV